MSGRARVFVGTDARMGRAERVLEHSLRRHASIEVELHWMRAGDPGFSNWNIGRKPGHPYSGRGWATEFSGFRFAVPELAEFQGRAVYLDVDMLVVGDVAELWRRRLRAPWARTGHRSEVSVIDCGAFADQPWWPSLIEQKSAPTQFAHCEALLEQHGWFDPSISREWNVLDRWTADARLIHFTNMRTQPWKPWPEVFDYLLRCTPRAMVRCTEVGTEAQRA